MAPNTPIRIDDHPRYDLRRFTMISSTVGVIISFVSIAQDVSEMIGPFFVLLPFFFTSFLLCLWDLIDWRLKQVNVPHRGPEDPSATETQPLLSTPTEDGSGNAPGEGDDDTPKQRPRAVILLLDLLLCFSMLYLWLCFTETLGYAYYSGVGYDTTQTIVIDSYGSAVLLTSGLGHGVCWWKGLMALKHTNWENALGRRAAVLEQYLTRLMEAPARRGALVDGARDGRVYGCSECTACRVAPTRRFVVVEEEEEDRIVDRLVRALRNLPESREDVGRRNQVVDVDAGPNRPNDVKDNGKGKAVNHDHDVEAGLDHKSDTDDILTPTASGSRHAVEPRDAFEVLSRSDVPASYRYRPSGAGVKAISNTDDAVIVKKKHSKSVRDQKGAVLGYESI